MPTGERGGVAASVRPQPLPATSEHSAPVKPALAGPLEPPHPELRAVGFQGGIQAFNQKAQAVVDAHRHEYGHDPSPAVVLDVVRSPVPPEQYSVLFQVPRTPGQARLRGIADKVQADPANGFFRQRPDGLLEPDSVLRRLVAPPDPAKPDPAAKKYPWVAAGFLPVKNFDDVVKALQTLASPGGAYQSTVGGQTLDQFVEDQKRGLPANSLDAMASAGTAATQKYGGAVKGITTVKQAQVELNKLMHTDLPEDGVFNDTWAKAVRNWTQSTDYFRRSTEFLAQQHHLSTADFVKAWRNKDRLITKHPAVAPLLEQMPLPLLVHAEDPTFSPVTDAYEYIGGREKLYDPSKYLHGLTRSAGLAFHIIGGTVDTLKADAAAFNAFMDAAGLTNAAGGHDYDTAKAKAHKVLLEHPSWLRVFYPGLDEHPRGLLGAADTVTNVIGDLVLLRKASFTGERVGYGDIVKAQKSPYIHAAGSQAFTQIGKGRLGRAAAMLENGQGGEQLIAVTSKSIQQGKLSFNEFREHLAELYATGKTEVVVPGGGTAKAAGVPKQDFYFNQFGMAFPHKFAEDAKTIARNIHDEHGNVIGSMVYDARSGRPNIYVESVFIRPEFRGDVSYFRRLVEPILKDGRPITADFENPRLQKLFERAVGREGIAGKVLSPKSDVSIVRGEAPQRELPPLIGPADSPKTFTVTGPVLASLRTTKLPTPGTIKNIQYHIRGVADQYDAWARRTSIPGQTNAANFVASVRAEFSHAVHQGSHGYFDPRMPERVHDYALGTFKDAGLANKWESDFVRARGAQNIPRMQRVIEQMDKLWHERFLHEPSPPQKPFDALLETEAPSIAKFRAGTDAKTDTFLGKAANSAAGVDRGLNTVAKMHAQVIIAGDPLPLVGGRSLFYKHMIADTLRRWAGGGFLFGRGIAKDEASLKATLASDKSLERRFGAAMDRTIYGETRWLLQPGKPEPRTSFQTGTQLDSKRHMDAAGGFLRRMVTSDALTAYQAASPADLSPLVDLIQNNKDFRGIFYAMKKGDKTFSQEDFAKLLYGRYRAFEDAAAAVGKTDPFDEATAVMRAGRDDQLALKGNLKPTHRAGVDAALGNWIRDNKLDFQVDGAQITQVGLWDAYHSTMIQSLMAFNKWNRGKFFNNITVKHYGDATAAGLEPKLAAQIAIDLAEHQTVFHMLDFANRLKVEQDLRWLSYFATKHRLYWKWLLGTFIRNPRYAAAVNDVSQQLDNGNLNLDVFGHKLTVPVARLVWVPGRDYSEVSPTALALIKASEGFAKGGPGAMFQAALNASPGTNGNILTRSDTGLSLGIHFIRMAIGNLPATYGSLMHSTWLSQQDRQRLARQINLYQLDYYAEHGRFNPDEGSVVKTILWKATATELWRANMPLPGVPGKDDKSERTKLLRQFMRLNDPAKRRKFLDDHKGFSDTFGVYQDPDVFLHQNEFFTRFSSLQAAYDTQRQDIFDRAVRDGFTPELIQEKKAMDKAHTAAFNQLLIKDAIRSGVKLEKGDIPGVGGVPLGKWGKLVENDPLINPHATLSKLFPSLETDQFGKVVGRLQTQLRAELALLNNPTYAATFPDPQEVKTRKGEILSQLSVFNSYPKDALGAANLEYQSKHAGRYWQEVERRYTKIAALPKGEKEIGYAEFRAWRDSQDKPVEITVDGKTVEFPSPIRMAWATLDPVTRKQRLAVLAAATWEHLTDYEKELLGHKPEPGTSKGWQLLDEMYRDQKKSLPPGTSIKAGETKRADARYISRYLAPGFYKDFVYANDQMRYQRLKLLVPYQGSPHKAEWDTLLGVADVYGKAIRAGAPVAVNKEAWKRYVDSPEFQGWLAEHQAFKKETALYGPDFLYSLFNH